MLQVHSSSQKDANSIWGKIAQSSESHLRIHPSEFYGFMQACIAELSDNFILI